MLSSGLQSWNSHKRSGAQGHWVIVTVSTHIAEISQQPSHGTVTCTKWGWVSFCPSRSEILHLPAGLAYGCCSSVGKKGLLSNITILRIFVGIFGPHLSFFLMFQNSSLIQESNWIFFFFPKSNTSELKLAGEDLFCSEALCELL